MWRFFTMFTVLLMAVFQLLFAQATDSLVKEEAYRAYIKAKELTIVQGQAERNQLTSSLVELDSLHRLAEHSRSVVSHQEQEARLQINNTNAAIASQEEGLKKNKEGSRKYQETQLETRRVLDLTKLDDTAVSHELMEVENRVKQGELNTATSALTIKELEDKVHDLGMAYRKYQNEVEVSKTEISAMTFAIEAAASKVEVAKELIKATAVRMTQLNSETAVQKQELQEAELKIASNKEKIEGRTLNETQWRNQVLEVEGKIAALEDFKKMKQQELSEIPDSLKSSTTIAGAQQEIRMADGKLKSLNEEKFSLENDLAQLKEESKVLASENQNIKNTEQTLQASLMRAASEQAELDSKYKAQRKVLEEMNVRIHDLAVQKEQKERTLQKAVGQLAFHTSEHQLKSAQLKHEEQELRASRASLRRHQEARDSLTVVHHKVEQEVSRLDGKDKIERHTINVLRDERATLNEVLDSTRREVVKVEKVSAAVTERLKLADEEVQGLADGKALLRNRLEELDNPAEEALLLGLAQAKQGDYEGFLMVLATALAREKSGELFVLQGYTQYVQGHFDAAEKSYTDAIRTSPRLIDSYELRSKLREETENYSGALKDVNQILYLDATKGQAFYQRGVLLHYFLNEMEEACEAWQSALSLGVIAANEQLAGHCLHTDEFRFYNVTQLTKRAVSASYGYDKMNPIKVGKHEKKRNQNIVQYLELLRDYKNQPVDYASLGSCCRYESENGLRGEALLERYLIKFRNEAGKKEEQILYFTYYDYEKPLLPVGLNTNHQIY